MRNYLAVLRHTGFRRLWLGATISSVGDGMTFVALSWLVLAQPDGTSGLGLLGVCYTAPVLVGGLLVGPVLDRFDKRVVLVVDSLLRAAAVASVPVTSMLGGTPSWLPFAVAATYGLLKMVPLAGFPAAIPQLVAERELEAANALESMSFSVAFVVGPALAGLLVNAAGPEVVLAVDGVSFLVFALAAATVREPLSPVITSKARRPSLAGLRRDRVIVTTTIAFMAFNIAEGMLLVTTPWLAKNHLPGGAATLGLLLAALAAGEIAGAALAGRRQRSLVAGIAVAQAGAALGFLGLLATPNHILVGAGFFVVGALSAPMTVWAQSLRMRRIPAELHGRAFATLRTLMQGTPPVGTLLATPLLAGDHLALAALTMALVAGLPAALVYANAETSGRRERSKMRKSSCYSPTNER
ncbi:MFS transporter [Actinophytocola sp.]|uniref:MFS transporter n=1 Tax=Actinophytocola sp. TaxID=1872138 RepID=UPI002ED69FBF